MFEQNMVMKGTLALALFFILFASCDSANNQHPSAKYEEKKTSLESMEKDSPLKFLKVTGDFHGNFVNQTVIEGEVTNNATLVSYKDLQLIVIFRDDKGSVIEKQKQPLDAVIKPGSTEDFKIKIGHVKGANSLSVDITDAKVAL